MSPPRTCSIENQVRSIMAKSALISRDDISGGMGSMLWRRRRLVGKRVGIWGRERGFEEECSSMAKKAADIMEALERGMTS